MIVKLMGNLCPNQGGYIRTAPSDTVVLSEKCQCKNDFMFCFRHAAAMRAQGASSAASGSSSSASGRSRPVSNGVSANNRGHNSG